MPPNENLNHCRAVSREKEMVWYQDSAMNRYRAIQNIKCWFGQHMANNRNRINEILAVDHTNRHLKDFKLLGWSIPKLFKYTKIYFTLLVVN